MPNLGSLWYTMGIKDLTDADLKKINDKLKNAGAKILLTPELAKSVSEILPKGLKLELDPQLKAVTNEMLAKAAEGKVMKVEVMPLISSLRKALKEATKNNPPEMEVGVQSAKLRKLIEDVLNKHGFLINISTVNDNYTKVVQQKLNGRTYKVKIHADAREISRSVQASLMQVQSRYFGLQVSRDILYRSIDEALGSHRFNINIAVQHDQARKAVQDALLRAQVIGKDQSLAYQRLQTGELKAAQAELMRLKAAHMDAADAAKAHSGATKDVGNSLFSLTGPINEVESMIANLWSIQAAKEFLSQVIEIGGELEHQKIAMDTIFGDKGKTLELFGQIKGLARQSPFGVMELTKSVKALSAYGVEYNEIYDTAKRLADISAATSVDINRLILAFGKTKSRGFLDGLEAKQFAYANIPIYEMVRKKLEELEGQTVTTAQVMARMKKREIGFDIVKDVLWDITDEGGKFYNMQEALAGSVKTSWKLVRDNIELMFGEIAESAVGSSLKSLAEILQGLTREWRTVGTVVGTAAIGLGVYKVAQIGVNSAVQKSTIATYNQIIAQKQKNAEELKAWGRITQLDKAEKMRIATANKLTNADLRRALTEGTLTDKHIAQLFWQKKLTAEQVKYLTSIGLLNPAMTKAILSNNRFTLSLQMMKQGLIKAGAAMKAFLLNPWTVIMTALSGAAVLYQHMSEQSDKARELGENLSTKTTEGARNLTEALKDLNGEFAKMSDVQLAGAIAKLEQVIKDYGVSSEKVLFYSNTDENGIVRTLEQRAEYLYKQAKILENAYAKFRDWKVSDMVTRASESTNGSLWKLQWYEGLQADLDDYVDSVRNAQKELTKYLRDHEDEAKLIVKFAADIDPEFAELTKEMGVEQAMTALTSNLERLQNVYANIPRERGRLVLDGSDLHRFANLSEQFLNNWTNTDIAHSMNEALKEAETAMSSLRKELLAKDKTFFDVDKWTEEKSRMMGMAFQEIFKNLEGLDYQFQMPFVDAWNKCFNTAFDPQFIEGQIQTQFSSLIPKLGEELAKKVRNGAQLEDAEKEKVKALFDKAVDSVKSAWPGKAAEIQKIVDSNPIYANVLLAVDNRAGMDAWKRQIDDVFGNTPDITVKIKGAADTQSTLKALAEMKKETKAALDRFALTFNISPNFGNLEKISTNGPLAPFEKQQREEYNKFVDLWNRFIKGEKELGINLDEWNKNKGDKGTPKDPLAESLKQRLDVLKKAYGEYKKELASMSKDAALERIKEAGIFDELFTGEDAITDFDSYETALEKLLAKAEASLKGMSEKDSRFKGRHDLVMSLRTLLNLEIPRDKTKEALDKAKREIDTLVSETTKKWDIYKRLFEFTGNKEASMKFAFGESVEWQSESANLKGLLDKQLEDKGLTDITLSISDEEAREKLEKLNLYDLWKKTKDAIENEEVELRINVAKAVYDAASNEEKIKILQDNRAARETEVRNKINPETGKKYTDIEIDALLKGEFDDKIDELRASMIELLPIWQQIFGDQQFKSYGQIEEASRIAKEIVDDAVVAGTDSNGRPKTYNSFYTDEEGNKQQLFGIKVSQIEKMRSALDSLYKEGEKKNPFKTLWKALNAVFNGDWKSKGTEEKIALLGQSAADCADLVGNLAGQLAEMFEAAGNDGAAQAMTDVQDVMSTVSNIGKGFAEGNLIGGIAAAAGEAIGWVTKAFQASARHKEALKAIMNETLAQQREYNLLLMQQNLEYKKAATIFGEDTYGKAKNAVKVMKDAYADLQDELEGTSEQQGNERRKANGDRIFAKVFGFGFDEAKAKLRQAYAGLADIEIKTGHKKTGLFGWGKGKDIYSSILDVYPELIDANGKFNASLAETIINTRVMSDEDKAALQNMIDLANQAEAAYEELNSYMTDIFGELGSTMTDALVSAFVNGSDAAEAFYDSVSDMLEALAKQMIYSVTLAPLIEEAQKKMMDVMQNDAMSDEQKFGAWTGILDGLLDDALKQQGVANDLFKKYQDMAAEKGFDIFKPDKEQKSGLSAGIQGVTEDTADLLASYLNSIRADVSLQTYDYWARLLNDSLPQISVIAQSQLDTQRQIAENTLRNAVAAETIVQYSKSIDDRLRRAQADKSTGFWMR